MRTALVLAASALALASCKTASEQMRITAIIGGTLIDRADATPLADAVVVVEGGRIRAAGPRATTPIPAGSEKIDASGFTIEPGRVVPAPEHAQLSEAELERRLNGFLASGVTSVQIASPGAGATALIARQRQGDVLTARIIEAAPAEGTAIAPGRPADLILLSEGAVKRVMLNGEWIVLDALPR